ncbi:MAG: TatD family hydrolase [Candidatus Carbobacillus altaicus]|nr:TatD family hydrolase [Candidatus Carbobacillus altaicus]
MSCALFDTHAHLDDPQYADDRAEVLKRAFEAGVAYIVNVGFSPERIQSTLDLTEEIFPFPTPRLFAAVGIHPTEAALFNEEVRVYLERAARHPKVRAIGEIGLDYYWDTSPRTLQQDVFEKQLSLAKALHLPVVIHNRDAHTDLLMVLEKHAPYPQGGVMHAFSGDDVFLREALSLGFYISFGGPVTFKNAPSLRALVPLVPDDRLLIETDAPYLSPHPYRGKRNESARVRLIAEKIAELKDMSYDELACLTTRNAKYLFKIDAAEDDSRTPQTI